MPEGTPSLASPTDHSFTLQAVMQMQKELGVLGAKIDGMRDDLGDLKTDGKETRDKLGGVKEDIASFKGAIKVFGLIYALALVLLGAFLAWYLRQPSQPSPPAPTMAVSPSPQPVAPQK